MNNMLRISNNARSEIERRWPGIDLERLDDVAAAFQHRNNTYGKVRPSDLATEFQSLMNATSNLKNKLWNMTNDASCELAVALMNSANISEADIMQTLGILDNALGGCWQRVKSEDGRSYPNPTSYLVVALARVLEDNGVVVNARPQGDLAIIFGIVSEALNSPVKDVKATVRDVLARREADQKGR